MAFWLVARAEDWLRSSLRGPEGAVSDACLPMHEPPVPLPPVKEPMTDAELERLRQSVKPGACFGREALYLRAACTRMGNAIR
ncbi:protein of unknown function [Nitrospira defluvii]|uniref:Uncharacterized protein n=1 Tax=Nitrospira defluvii TaxID=330214 RepID=D8PER0_9BACT|nr:protein of unknown function [Nitrospira defluvii]